MTEPSEQTELELYHWSTVFATLSLDVATPFASRMGLQLPEGDSFNKGLRNIIEDYRRNEKRQSNLEATFHRTVFNWVSIDYGPAFSEHLYDWGRNVFQTGDFSDCGVFLWSSIVRRGGLYGERDPRLPPDFVVTLCRMLSQRDKAPVNNTQPATKWDKALYERHHFDEFYNPMELVQATINHYDFICAWQDAVTAEGAFDREQLKEWALGEALELGISPDDLSEPGLWPPPPPLWDLR